MLQKNDKLNSYKHFKKLFILKKHYNNINVIEEFGNLPSFYFTPYTVDFQISKVKVTHAQTREVL